MRLGGLILFLLLITAVTSACSTTPTPPLAAATPPATTYKIAFISHRDGNDEIYVMNADGSGLTNLTNNRANDGAPSWSPR